MASLTDFASVDTTVISATMTSVVDRMTSASNTYSTGPYTLMSTEPCMMPGSPEKMPMALDAAMSRPMTVMASTLPSAMGVARSVAMVPRSFSPATDSAAMDMTLLNTRMSSRSGTMDTTSMPATSRSSATS